MGNSKKKAPSQDRFHVKKNDLVVVISGTQRGKRGKVLQILKKNNRVLIEGVNLIKAAAKKTQEAPQGGIVEREGSVHISNVVLADKFDAKRSAAKPETKTAKKSEAKK